MRMSSRASGAAASSSPSVKTPVKPSSPHVASSSTDQASTKQDFQLADALSLVKTARAAGLNLPDNATYIFMPPKTVNGPTSFPSTPSPSPSPKTPTLLKRSHSQTSMKNGTIEKNKNLFGSPHSAKKRRRGLLGDALKRTPSSNSVERPLSRRSTRSAATTSKDALLTEDEESEMEASTSNGISSEVAGKTPSKKDGGEGGQRRQAYEDEYEVEKIIRKKVVSHGGGKRTRYLVKWLGHEETTWEPRSHFASDNDAWIRFRREDALRSARIRADRKKKKKMAGREGSIGDGGGGGSGRKSAQSSTPEGDSVEVDGPKKEMNGGEKKKEEKTEEKGKEGGKSEEGKMEVEEDETVDSDESTISTIILPETPLDPKAAMKEVEELDEDVMALSSTSPLKKSASAPTVAADEPAKSPEATPVATIAAKEVATPSQPAPSSSSSFPSTFTVLRVGPAGTPQPNLQALTLTQVSNKPVLSVTQPTQSTSQQNADSGSTPVISARVPISSITAMATSSQPSNSTGFPTRNGSAGKRPEVTMTTSAGNVYTIKAIKARPPFTVAAPASNGPRPIMTVMTPLPPQKKTPAYSTVTFPPSPEIPAPSMAPTFTTTTRVGPTFTTKASVSGRILSNLMTTKRTLPPQVAVQFRAPLPIASMPSTSGTQQQQRTVSFNKNIVNIPHNTTQNNVRPTVQPVRRPVNPFATLPVKTIANVSVNTALTCTGAKSLIPDMGSNGKSGLDSGSLVVGITGFKPREAGITCLNDVSFLISYADRDPEFVDYEVCIQKIPHEVAEFLFKNRIYALDSQPVRLN